MGKFSYFERFFVENQQPKQQQQQRRRRFGVQSDAKAFVEENPERFQQQLIPQTTQSNNNNNNNNAPPVIDITTNYYKMDHDKRGLAIIFNHQRFDEYLGLKQRDGTDIDCYKMTETLKALDFNVNIYNDLTFDEIRERLNDISNYDHNDSDCLWICVLTHGLNGLLYAKDKPYEIDHILYFLTIDRCKTLAGKPKILTFQACQGERVDFGQPTTFVQRDGQRIVLYSVPTRADFLLIHSSPPGYVSYRHTENGSWFINVLTQHLKEKAYHVDIFTLITAVAQHVALNYRKQSKLSPMQYEQQMPYFTSTLTKRLQFVPKK